MSAGQTQIIYQLARADFLERVRRYSFLVTLAFTLYLGYLGATGRILLNLGDYQGSHNAAYIGGFMAYVTAIFLSLAGFYIVKNAIERDRQTRVGQILAASPMTRISYCTGKFLSNLGVLLAMVGVLAIAAIVMYAIVGDGSGFSLFLLLTPFLFLTLPAMALVAALALLFETIPALRRGFGNVVYFFLYNGLLSLGIVQFVTSTPHPFLDWTGGFTLDASMAAAAKAQFPGAVVNSFSLTIGKLDNVVPHVFHWNGFQWTAEILMSRLFWFGVAIGVTMLAATLFDRFDPARGRPQLAAFQGNGASEMAVTNTRAPAETFSAARLAKAATRFRFGSMFTAEFRLMLKGQHWWWYVVALGFLIAETATPLPAARSQILIFAWIWPVLLWSAMGTREAGWETAPLVFSSARSLSRQLPAAWLAGVAVALLTGSGYGIRLVIASDERGLFAWLVGALFIPSLALAMGVWSGSSKLFEIIYLLLWYIGPLHAVRQFDFMGVSPGAAAAGTAYYFFAAAVMLFVAAFAGRRRQLQN
ncbi:MAG TPA: ABC transporter permease subunit [Candidatus Acidoferrales bacterium]|nr:ABC transporter permease subunit [Candidatus Acidoferrales bacterium]